MVNSLRSPNTTNHIQTVTAEASPEEHLQLSLIVPPLPPLSERMEAAAGHVLDNTNDEQIFIIRPSTAVKERNIAERIRRNREKAEKRQAELKKQEDEHERHALQQVLAAQAEIRRNVSIGEIITEICTLPLSEESQIELEQWIKDFLSNRDDVQRQISLSALLIFNFLRPLVEQLPDELTLADVETKLFLWIAQRLSPGQDIETFKQRCRQALIIKASQEIALVSLDAYGRDLLRSRAQSVQHQAQTSSRQITHAMSSFQQQQRQAHQINATRTQALREQLREEENKFGVQLHQTEARGEQANITRASLTEQLNRLTQETSQI